MFTKMSLVLFSLTFLSQLVTSWKLGSTDSDKQDVLYYEVKKMADDPFTLALARKFEERLSEIPVSTKNSSACACIGYNCGCCLHLEWKKINLNDTVCANFSYLPAPEYGISITLSLDNKTIFNETVSARNPPPVCAGVPYLKEYASLCVRFTNLTVANHSLSGCVSIEAKLEGFVVEDIKLGCFRIPPSESKGRQLVPPGSRTESRQDARSPGYRSPVATKTPVADDKLHFVPKSK